MCSKSSASRRWLLMLMLSLFQGNWRLVPIEARIHRPNPLARPTRCKTIRRCHCFRRIFVQSCYLFKGKLLVAWRGKGKKPRNNYEIYSLAWLEEVRNTLPDVYIYIYTYVWIPRKKATNIFNNIKHPNITCLEEDFSLLGFLQPRYIAPQKALL